MIIRNATEKDIDSIYAIEKTVEPDLAASTETLLERLHMFPDGFYVAEENGEIVGYIESCLWDKRDFKTFDDVSEFSKHHNEAGKTLYVIFMVVVPTFQKRGIGSQLLRNAISLAQRMGRQRIQLVAKDGLDPFYTKRGFRAIRELPEYLPRMNAILMEREVSNTISRARATALSSRP